MDKKSSLILTVSAIMVFGMIMIPGNISAETAKNSISVTPLNEDASLQKTIATMTVPEDNKLPWGTVKGVPSDYVERYPVIIQFYQNEEPVHIAQVGLKGDGSYEYKFRVGSLNYETGEFENFFKGDYTVKIFKVIPNTDSII